MQDARTNTLLLGVLATITVGWVLHVGATVLQPLVIAGLLAITLQPVVRWLARLYIPPPVTILALVVLLFWGLVQLGILVQTNLSAFVGAPVQIVAPAASPPLTPDALVQSPPSPLIPAPDDEAAPAEPGASRPVPAEPDVAVATTDPRRSPSLEGLLQAQESAAEELGGWPGVVERVGARLYGSALPDTLVTLLVDAMKGLEVQKLTRDAIGTGVGFTRGLVLVLIYLIFIFAEQAVFKRKILSVAGDRREEAEEIIDTIGRGTQRYLGVKTLVSAITGIVAFFVLLWLQIPYAALFGLLTFLLNYIPTFGSIAAGAFPTITALAVEPTWATAAWVVVAYMAINVVLGNMIEPRVLGRELNLSPLVIVISVLVWGTLWGVAGAFLAVPLTSAIQIVLASQERTLPIAVLLSSGPPDAEGRHHGPIGRLVEMARARRPRT